MNTPDPITTAHGWTDEVRQAVTALEDKYGIELIGGPHHAKWVDAACYEIGGGAIRMYKDDVEKLKAERDEAQEAADNAPWPQWADDIRKKLMEFGYDAGPEGEWNIGESFEDWMDGTFGEYERRKDAEITRLTSQLEQAERFAELISDCFKEHDYSDCADDEPMVIDATAGDMRRASQWIKDRQAKTDVAIGDK